MKERQSMKGFLRTLVSLLALTLLLAGVCACKAEESGDARFPEDGFFMTARVIAISDRVEVEVIESEYISGLVWVNTNGETLVLDEEGQKIEVSDLAADDVIKIAYSGQVMMSYPAQIVGLAIQKVNE